MGLGQSKSGSIPTGLTRDTLLTATEPMRRVADEALQIMLERITSRDLLSLSSPSECSKYVMVIGSAFDQFFRSVDVVPVLKGKPPQTVYFQRVDVLTGRASSGSKELDAAYAAYRQNICKALGYFFTKFLQIFAALSLSIFDDPNLRPGSYDPFSGIRAGVGFGAQRYGPVLGSLESPGRQMYGGSADDDGDSRSSDSDSSDEEAKELPLQQGGGYREFRETSFEMSKPKTVTDLYGRTTSDYYQIKGRNTIESRLYICYRPVENNIRRGALSLVNIYSNIEELSVIIDISINTNTNYVSIKPLYVNRKNRSGYQITPEVILQFEYDSAFKKYRLNGYTGASKFLEKGNQYNFDTAINNLMKYVLNPRDYDSNTNNYTRRQYIDGRRQPDRKRDHYEYHTTAPSQAVPEEIKPIFTALQGQMRPVAHCIARSLQLVNMEALTGSSPAVSHLCNFKFLEPHPTGLPQPGRPLSSSPGLKSLETLFYVFQNNAVQITDANRGEYMQFLMQLDKIYDTPNRQGGDIAKFTELINKTDGQICSQLPLTQNVFRLAAGPETDAAKVAVMKLWGKQIEHAREVDKIFSQMFYRDKKTNQLRISPNILHLGLPGLDTIAANARKLLVKYYTDCEFEYRQGVASIYNIRARASQLVATRPAPAQAQAPAQIRPSAPTAPGLRAVQTPVPVRRTGGVPPQRGGNYTRKNTHSDAL
jgi:hypothetical protein